MSFHLEYRNNKFSLVTKDKIPTSTKLQIKYFGFKIIDDSNLNFETKSNDLDLNELIKFFKDNDYNFTFCDNTKKILNKKFEKDVSFKEKVKRLEKIKDNLDNNNFSSFDKKINYLKRELKDHQKKSLFHLLNSDCAANFSVPGSGKTSVVLAFYEYLKLQNKVDAIFLIGPKNCYLSWNREFKLNLGRDSKLKILDENKVKRKKIYEGKSKSEVFACHFSTVTNDLSLLKEFFLTKNFLLVIDEAHNIKKIGGLWSRSILELRFLSKYKIILTGTPMPQDFKDFYNYFDFLYPNDEIINSRQKAEIEVFIDNNNFDQAANLINEKIYPFYTRVTKKQLGLSKPNFIKPYLVKMNPIEDKIHKAIITKIKFYTKFDYLKNIELIKKIQRARMIRLRQTCSYVKNLITAIPPDLRKGDENLLNDQDLQNLIAKYDLNEKPAKIEFHKNICQKLIKKKEKVLIWSTHLKTIDLILKELNTVGINIKVITGKTKLEEREKISDEFNDELSNLNALVAIPQACSESISLHKACHNAIYYDMNYNTSEFLQSLDRIHRVGGSEKSPVYYHFLHYENSIDTKVYERVFQKANRQMQVIESDNLTFSHPEDEDWDNLYSELSL